MELGGIERGRAVTPEQAETILNAVLNSGINYIDTSLDYGQSEIFIGKYISHRRSEYYLATKCGCVVGADPVPQGRPNPHSFTPENIVAGVHQSLERLKTDYIDVMQIHAGPSKETLEEHGAVEALLDLKREGKIRFIGMSSYLPNLASHIDMGVFEVLQIPYSALHREHEQVITQAAQGGAGTVIRAGAIKGIPSGGKQSGPSWDLWQQTRLDELLEGMSRMEFTLRFTITHPNLHTTIVGTLNPDHMRENLNSLQKGPLPQDLYEEAKRRLPELGILAKQV